LVLSNFFRRTLTGVWIVLFIFGGFWLHPISFFLTGLILLIGTQYEYYLMISNTGVKPQMLTGIFTGLIAYILSTLIAAGKIPSNFLLILIPLMSVIMIVELYRKQEKPFDSLAHTFFSVLFTAVPFSMLPFAAFSRNGLDSRILESFKGQLERFIREYNFVPKIIVIKDMGLLAVEDSYAAAESVLDVYEDLIRICHYSSHCRGARLLTPDQISFIDKWEVENYRRKVAQGEDTRNNLKNKIAIVTGGAQGFGAGIAEALYALKVNMVVADLNEEAGLKFVLELNKQKSSNRAVFIKTDVSDPESVRNLIISTVREFGGLDIMISNAGILRAGGLDEMEPDLFSKTTDVNYNGYFYCVKYASEVMKLQNREKSDYFADIIQINSKSGLRGSNRNFAYAGAKFGGIGLTQSFAMELAPHRIKVNSICPGNFYEGPLWSDPHTGLFVQYLKTGKVPGAKNIEDVRKFYENQVPMKRGCRLEDVMKAVLYVIDQKYETGQAIPVTGGQVMLG